MNSKKGKSKNCSKKDLLFFRLSREPCTASHFSRLDYGIEKQHILGDNLDNLE